MQSLQLKAKKNLGTNRRHPWVYSGAITNIPSSLKAGDVVEIRAADSQLVGYGHFAVGKSIVCRVFNFTSQSTPIEDSFWQQKFAKAYAYRKTLGLIDNPETNSYRLFNSEGDELPGLTCDIYANCASLNISSEGIERILPLIVEFLKDTVGIQSIFVKNAKQTRWLSEACHEVQFQEHKIPFVCNFELGQKTGYFLDQRDNRALLGQYAAGRTVLDTFCYMGGFGLHALKHGASHVTFVDASKPALENIEKNLAHNFPNSNHKLEATDCFEYLRKLEKDRFDLIVLDPPAFAKKENFVIQAARGYKELNMMAFKKIKAGGILFSFSCSQAISRELFRKIIYQAALDAGRSVRIIHELSQAPDHPVHIYHPEGEYLKGLALYVE